MGEDNADDRWKSGGELKLRQNEPKSKTSRQLCFQKCKRSMTMQVLRFKGRSFVSKPAPEKVKKERTKERIEKRESSRKRVDRFWISQGHKKKVKGAIYTSQW